MSICFVHCADLHLDSPFVGIHSLQPEIASVLRDATFKAFNNVIDIAIRKKADFLIIAGDIYDGADRSLRAQLQFRDGLYRIVENGIQCFITHGNHDPLSGWEAGLRMPDGVHRFSGEGVERIVAKRGSEELAYIYGISYPVRDVQENLVPRFQREEGSPFTIGVLHCNVSGDPNHDNYAPCTVDDLIRCGMDYWALGHIHLKKVLREHEPCIVYPGNTQGRNIRELGERGCYIVQVDETGSISLEFVTTDEVRWFIEEVNITDLKTVDDLLEALQRKCEEVRIPAEGHAAILRLRLIGRGDLHAKLRHMETEYDLVSQLREDEVGRPDFVWVESVQVATRPPIDIEQRRTVEDFVGDFLRAVETLGTQPNVGRETLNLLKNRSEHRIIAEELGHLSDADLLSIIKDAEIWGLDQLLGEEE